MEWLTSFTEYGFLARAMVAGILVAITCALISPFIVLRRMAFSADGLAHASLGGVALGLLIFDSGPLPGPKSYLLSFLVTCLIGAAIAYLGGSRRMHSDTAIGACYVAAFAAGVLLLALRKRYTVHLESLFFGSLLSANPLECWLLAGLFLAVLLCCLLHWRWLWQWCFDAEIAGAAGVPVRALRYGILIITAATVTLATKIVGLLLVTALMILPGATAILVGRSATAILLGSVCTSILAMLGGILAANGLNVPPGPVVVLLAFLFFIGTFAAVQLKK